MDGREDANVSKHAIVYYVLREQGYQLFGHFLKRLNHIRFLSVKPRPAQKRNATMYIESGDKAPHISSLDARFNTVVS
jgi:hypothetical protein